MARKGQQTERVVVNVTPEQWAAVEEAIAHAIAVHMAFPTDGVKPKKNDVLLKMLQALCRNENVEWPEHVKQQGARTDLKPTPNK